MNESLQNKNSLNNKKSAEVRFIVGIGSSAGGLEALRTLFGCLGQNVPMAFVVVQHLAPSHKSRLVEILAQSTHLKVKEVEDGERPETSVIYITPPNADVYFENGHLRLMEPHLKIGPKPSVDFFFRSLADNFGSSAIGIVLSGTGSDGAHGVRAIKAAGGFTISQKASTAKYDGMPRAAKHTGAVDLELSPEEIAQELSRFGKIPRRVQREKSEPADDDHFDRIFAILEREKGACFANYKPSTIRRRVERRIIATRCASIKEYAEYLQNNPAESSNLFQDILISVTAFFRDPEAYEALEKHVSEKIQAKQNGDSFRCWIIGCATGEEPYSITIMICELVERFGKKLSLQVFATDLDETALEVARRGSYSRASFDKFPPELREKYFVTYEDQLQVRPFLRDLIIFSRHNVIEDPPFLNTDLVSCRNVLIYFNQSLQERVFKTICYSLGKGGILFLGRSEAVSGHASHLFQVQDKEARIFYSMKERSGTILPVLKAGYSDMPNPGEKKHAEREESEAELFQAMIAGFAPDSVIIDETSRVKHTFGKASEYLSFPAGEVTVDVSRLLPDEMGKELPSLLYRVSKSLGSAQGKQHEIKQNGQLYLVQMTVAPLKLKGESKQYLLAFAKSPKLPEPAPAYTSNGKPAEERTRELEKELISVKEQLQSIMEEYQASNEELQSLNEELRSANEELQSSNEELETTNEELQSSNEELTTLNQELNVKSAELQVLYNRHQAIQNAIAYPLLIIDEKLNLLDFNPSARHLLRISESDIGTQLRSIPTPLDFTDIINAVGKALREQKNSRFQYQTKDRSFEIQVQVFFGEKNTVAGSVVSFIDNTEISMALDEARVMKSRLASIIDNTPAMITMKDLSGVYILANNRFCEVMGKKPEDVIGSTDEELFDHVIAKQIRDTDFEVLKQDEGLQMEESFFIGGQTHVWTSSKFTLFNARSRPYAVCTISLDITERAIRERQLELFRHIISSANSGAVILEDSGNGLAVSFCSEQLCKLLGVNSSDLLGINLEDFLHSIHMQGKPRSVSELAKAIEESREASFTFTALMPRGEELTFELRSAKIDSFDDIKSHIILSIFDVTERLKDQQIILSQQEELSRYARFSALGEIAAGISHEINTPLNVITANTDILQRAVKMNKLNDHLVIQSAQDIETMAKGISNIVRGLKSVAGIDPGTFEYASMQKLISDALKICQLRIQRSDVDLQVEMPNGDLMVRCYAIQIMQVIINLVNNALEAIAGTENPWIKIVLKEQDEKVCVTVTDSGNGIDARLTEKIMTPFFSTKKMQNGTGMGLSLSRAIARRHNGDLVVDPSAPNTTFRLEITKDQPRSMAV
jgi:two-component system CheB/CheR fusion protein